MEISDCLHMPMLAYVGFFYYQTTYISYRFKSLKNINLIRNLSYHLSLTNSESVSEETPFRAKESPLKHARPERVNWRWYDYWGIVA